MVVVEEARKCGICDKRMNVQRSFEALALLEYVYWCEVCDRVPTKAKKAQS